MGGLFSKNQVENKPKQAKDNYGGMYNSQSSYQVPQPIPKPIPQRIYQPVSQPISKPVPQPVVERERVLYPRPVSQAMRESYTSKEPNQYLPRTQQTKTQSYRSYQPDNQPKSQPLNFKRSKHQGKTQTTIQAPNFDPYEGCLGKWVSRSEFTGTSSTFGYFKCDSCHKTWMSAHSKKQFKQACKSCNQYFLPAYLWVNDSKNYQRKEKALVDNLKHHLSDLCEACKKGKCKLNRTYHAASYDASNDYPRAAQRQQDYGDYYD